MFNLSQTLSQADIETVKQCLQAAVDGPFFPEWEFEALFGVNRGLVRAVLNEWPAGAMSEDDVGCAVVGSLNNLLGYPHGHESELARYVAMPLDEVRGTLDRLLALGL
ncbi:hypothetical protein [Caenimonas sp. SL110]|uniref:hypothetical protein n=1 Tax=Caenimonas sp. SL110 TaxID=1450524 RepID=UPI00069E45A4|nr:hypothetical protein [Caenimonas sp. SL110]